MSTLRRTIRVLAGTQPPRILAARPWDCPQGLDALASAAPGYCVGLTTPPYWRGIISRAQHPRPFGGGRCPHCACFAVLIIWGDLPGDGQPIRGGWRMGFSRGGFGQTDRP